ncbi:MAG TPA: peptidase domain-containing ABC transporter [Thermoanaerobaculia bacterium]|nr:peptidase domain-containing ABC transporter [Thermoanaerobaculia bacterium]
MRRFPVIRQLDQLDCGPTCLRIIARHYGRELPAQAVREQCNTGRSGSSFQSMLGAAEALGFKAVAARATYDDLRRATLPCVAYWQGRHYVVVYRVEAGRVWVSDPAHGRIRYSREEFLAAWMPSGQERGAVLFMEPSTDAHAAPVAATGGRVNLDLLRRYIAPHKSLFVQLFLGLLVLSALQLVAPFLTQAVVDHGIASRNLGFIRLILIAQLTMSVSRAAVEFIRNRLLLHAGARIHISVISDFLRKLMRLPLSFYDNRQIGDILQRISDHQRLQSFLTSTSLGSIFSLLNFIVFSFVLLHYSGAIFLVFCGATILSSAWVLLFQRRRREIDFRRFSRSAENQSGLVQVILGIQEIKLSGCESRKRREWEELQARTFEVSLAGVSLGQYQQGGMLLIHELKNIVIAFLSASYVIEGRMTLGMMMAISYIIGQLSAPVEQLLAFLQSAQDAKLSMERIAEIEDVAEEDHQLREPRPVPRGAGIALRDVSFAYVPGQEVLQRIDLEIPHGSTTAIVGSSGSGKTTLLKLLLKIQEPRGGSIALGDTPLSSIESASWRARCGVVMQDGFIFADTVERNIAVGAAEVDRERLRAALRTAHLEEFIDSLPMGAATRIGADGQGLSQGQRQRVLLARALYKDPDYLFFDEATSSLDATTERAIMNDLEPVLRDRTVVIIAHRLSTVTSADQIIVLDRGRIVEQGTHTELTAQRSTYYHLVRNQLELGR